MDPVPETTVSLTDRQPACGGGKGRRDGLRDRRPPLVSCDPRDGVRGEDIQHLTAETSARDSLHVKRPQLISSRDREVPSIDISMERHGAERDIRVEDERAHPMRAVCESDRESAAGSHPMRAPCESDRESAAGSHPVRAPCESDRESAAGSHPMRAPCESDRESAAGSHPMRGGYERDRHPMKGYDRLSLDRAHTMKDFEKQITELKKENFNLKLRIYFLEEQIQRRCDNSSEELHRMNVELKVEVESLKHDFQEKQNLLVRASKAMESLAAEHSCGTQQLRVEHLKELQDLEESWSHKIRLLEEERKHEKAELENICMLLNQERMQRLNAEERLAALTQQYDKSVGILQERDWIVKCLNETLHSKDAVIAQLEKHISTIAPYGTSVEKASKMRNGVPEGDAKDCQRQISDPTCNGSHPLTSSEETVNEWQKKIKEMGNLINELQHKLEASKAGITAEEKNALKRDKAIQGLTLALKTKTKENDKLLKEIDNLNAALSKAREPSSHVHLQNLKENNNPEYKTLVFKLEAEQELHSKLIEYERESGALQKELDAIAMLRRWLEENIQTNQELRRIMEAQILANCRENDTISFLGDQTSYLSICLGHIGQDDLLLSQKHEGTTQKQSPSILESGTADLVHMESGKLQTVCQGQALTEEKQVCSCRNNKLGTEMVSKKESFADVAIQVNEALARQKQMVSSATQTELKCYADKSILVYDTLFGEDEVEMEDNSQNEKKRTADPQSIERSLNGSKNHPRLQGDIHSPYPIDLDAKKSRIPVLLKSSLSAKVKSENALLSKENEHMSLEKALQVENHKLYKQLKSAEMEIEAFKANDALAKGSIMSGFINLDKAERDNSSECSLQTDLLLENHRLAEQLKCAQIEIERLQSSCVISKPMDISSALFMDNTEGDSTGHFGMDNANKAERDPTGQSGVDDANKVERDPTGQSDVDDASKAQRDPTGQPGVDDSNKAERDPTGQSVVDDANKVERDPMGQSGMGDANKVQRDPTGPSGVDDANKAQRVPTGQSGVDDANKAQRDPTGQSGVDDANKAQRDPTGQSGVDDANKAQRDPTGQSGVNDANKAQRDPTGQSGVDESNKAQRDPTGQSGVDDANKVQSDPMGQSGVDDANKAQRDPLAQSLQKELELENCRLLDQLKHAHMEIKKLQADKVLFADNDNSVNTDNTNSEDGDFSEQSFLEKTITNSVSLNEIHHNNADVDGCRRDVNSLHVAGLYCHDDYIADCNNRIESLFIQASKSNRISETHEKFSLKVSSSLRSFEDTSLSKYDLLVQSQARELSLQRQKIKESHNLSVICSKNFFNVLKAFEDLFQSSNLDSNIALGFQEQITQTIEWLKELEYKLSDAFYGEEDSFSDHSTDSFLYTPSRLVPGHRMFADKHGCHVLGLVEDYNALRKQILEARNVLQETEAFVDHGVQTAVLTMTDHFGNIFFEKLNRTKQSLDEASSLLKLLWRVSLPLQMHSTYSVNQEEETGLEITRLRKRVLEQEKVISGMMKRVYSESHMKEDIEKLILDQLAMTHDVLKKAKGNLVVQVVDKNH